MDYIADDKKVFNLNEVQKNFMNDLRDKLNVKDSDTLHITIKKKKCDCPTCNNCFEYINISDKLENLKIMYDTEYQLEEILKTIKDFKPKN